MPAGPPLAVAEIGKHQFCGFVAWLMWLFIHLNRITLFENRILVFLLWLWNYTTFNRSARLVTAGSQPADHPLLVHESPRVKAAGETEHGQAVH